MTRNNLILAIRILLILAAGFLIGAQWMFTWFPKEWPCPELPEWPTPEPTHTARPTYTAAPTWTLAPTGTPCPVLEPTIAVLETRIEQAIQTAVALQTQCVRTATPTQTNTPPQMPTVTPTPAGGLCAACGPGLPKCQDGLWCAACGGDRWLCVRITSPNSDCQWCLGFDAVMSWGGE